MAWRAPSPSPSRLSRHTPPSQTALAPNAPKLGFSLGGAPPPPRGFKPGLATSAFGAEEASKPRVLQKLDDDESAAPAPSLSDNQSSARAATDEDAKKRDRAIAEAIPTDADQLFKATVDWAAVLLPVSCIFIKLIMLCRWSARASSRPSCGPGSPKKSPSIWGRKNRH